LISQFNNEHKNMTTSQSDLSQLETSAKPSSKRSGVSAERRKTLEIKECGFLPKTATPLFQRPHLGNT
jgi:hypothetical protein